MPGYPKNFLANWVAQASPKAMIDQLEDNIEVVVDELASGLLGYEPDITTNSLSGSMILNATIGSSKIVVADWATKQNAIALSSLSGVYLADGSVLARKTDFLTVGVSGLSLGKFGPLRDADGVNVYLYISGGAVQTSRT